MTASLQWVGPQRVELPPDADAGEGRRLWLAERVPPTARVLDLGGTGGMLRPWHVGHVTAVDDLSGFGPGHRIEADRFLRGDVEAPPAELQQVVATEGRFDVAVLAEVLEHCGRPVRAIREASRLAKRVLITTPFEHGWQNVLRFRVSGHIRFYFPEFFAHHLVEAPTVGTYGLLAFGSWSFLVADVCAPGDAA